MADYVELIRLLSVPRPSGSTAECVTVQALAGWIERHDIPYRRQPFTLYPHFFEAIGAWIILSRTLLAAVVALRWGWPALLIAIVGAIGGLADKAFLWPLVTWPGRQKGENLLIEFQPVRETTGGTETQESACRELIISAHYDSKTELLDHVRRMFFLKRLALGVALTVLVGLLAFADALLRPPAPSWANVAFGAAMVLCVPLLFLSWGLGLHLSVGRLVAPSQGAVDNGAACAVLLGLAERLAAGQIPLQCTKVTLALFGGEEVNMQGSRAYVRGRDWPLPAAALNLEVLGQDGGYVYFQRDGDMIRWRDTSPELTQALVRAVSKVTGDPPRPVAAINSDGFSFLAAGIPTAVLGGYDSRLELGGFHKPTDNLQRVRLERLPEAVEILSAFIRSFDMN